MSKVKIKVGIKNPFEDEKTYNLHGIKNGNTISYKEDGISCKTVFYENYLEINRSGSDYQLSLTFINKQIIKGKYNIDNICNVTIFSKTNKLDMLNNKLYLEYDLNINGKDSGPYIFKFEYEVVK